MFEPPKKDQFTQGTIFSCAHSESYPEVPVYGLVITARCDAAQRKVPIYSFIPVVSLKNWIYRDGAEIILTRQLANLRNSQTETLEALEVSPSVLRTMPVRDVIEKLLKPIAASDRKSSNRVDKFITSQDQIEDIQSALDTCESDALREVLSKATKVTDQVVKELAGNRLLGFYLLRDMPTVYGEKPEHCVALLREVHHIPNALAERIIQGITSDDWRENPILEVKCPRFVLDEDYSAPVARLRSPWIEHLMQTWALLFTRIGVEDADLPSIKRAVAEAGLEIQ